MHTPVETGNSIADSVQYTINAVDFSGSDVKRSLVIQNIHRFFPGGGWVPHSTHHPAIEKR
jgi:hypothetical protein